MHDPGPSPNTPDKSHYTSNRFVLWGHKYCEISSKDNRADGHYFPRLTIMAASDSKLLRTPLKLFDLVLTYAKVRSLPLNLLKCWKCLILTFYDRFNYTRGVTSNSFF